MAMHGDYTTGDYVSITTTGTSGNITVYDNTSTYKKHLVKDIHQNQNQININYPPFTASKCEFCDTDMELFAKAHVCAKCKAVFKAMLAVFSEQS